MKLKKVLGITLILLLTLMIGIKLDISLVRGQPIELFYDDGEADGGEVRLANGTYGFGIRLEHPEEGVRYRIQSVKFYITINPYNKPLRLFVFAGRPFSESFDKVYESIVETSEGWNIIDLNHCTLVTFGDLLVGFNWVVNNDPHLGVDTDTESHSVRFRTGYDEDSPDRIIGTFNYMIRAQVIDEREITPAAIITWYPPIAEVDGIVTFDGGYSEPNGGTITSYEWIFGDGENATGRIVTHAYASPDTYTVYLKVTDSESLFDWESKEIQVVQPHGPEARFTATPDTASTGEPVKFDASASLPGWNGTHGMPITEYRWDFDDGNKTTTFTPIVYHSFSNEGIYYVTLTVYAPGATPETDSTTQKVTIISIPIGGYSIPIKGYTTEKPLTLYLALIAILTVSFTMIKRKARRRAKLHQEETTISI